MRAAGVDFDAMPADVDETLHEGESRTVSQWELANAKACGVLARSHGRPVVAADTVVVVDGHILGKPADAVDAQDAAAALREAARGA